MTDRYYYEHDPDYETMPYRIYRRADNKDSSIEICKAYDKKDAELVVVALNILFFIRQCLNI